GGAALRTSRVGPPTRASPVGRADCALAWPVPPAASVAATPACMKFLRLTWRVMLPSLSVLERADRSPAAGEASRPRPRFSVAAVPPVPYDARVSGGLHDPCAAG